MIMGFKSFPDTGIIQASSKSNRGSNQYLCFVLFSPAVRIFTGFGFLDICQHNMAVLQTMPS